MLPRRASASMGGLVLGLQFVGHFRRHGTSLCVWTIAATEHVVGVFLRGVNACSRLKNLFDNYFIIILQNRSYNCVSMILLFDRSQVR